MATYIVFTRAINVGKRFIKMSDLREGLSHRGFVAVESHILSGNLRLRSSLRSTAKVEQSVEKAMQELCGFEVRTIVRTPEQLSEISSYGASLLSPLAGDVQRYVTFLKEEPDDELIATMNGWDFAGERAHINGREVYVWLSHLSHEAKAPPAAALQGSSGRTCPKTSRSGARVGGLGARERRGFACHGSGSHMARAATSRGGPCGSDLLNCYQESSLPPRFLPETSESSGLWFVSSFPPLLLEWLEVVAPLLLERPEFELSAPARPRRWETFESSTPSEPSSAP